MLEVRILPGEPKSLSLINYRVWVEHSVHDRMLGHFCILPFTPLRRVSTTLRQVLTEFSELFSFPPRNFSPGSPSNDDRRLGRPTASPLFLSSSGFRFSKVDRCCFICLRLQTAVSEWKPVC